MATAVLLSDNETTKNETEKLLSKQGICCISVSNPLKIDDILNSSDVNIFIYDCESNNIDIQECARNYKFTLQTKDIRSIALLKKEMSEYGILKYVNSYIIRPVNENLFETTVNSNLQLCETFRNVSKNNNDLAKSLYQLNVLYNTGTQLAGTLDKMKLTDIMTEGLDLGLSLSLCYALVFNDSSDVKLIIKSLFPVSSRLENAIKLRALLSYKNLFSVNPNLENIIVEKHAKDKFGEYDLNIFNFDNLFAPLNINDKFFGIIEVFRENDFTTDDTKCFNTLVKQVSLPLKSAILYDEIKYKNEKLEKLERLKSEFISIVSHELKTPLTSLNSSLDIILKGMAGEINETAEKFLNLAKKNVIRLSAIIKDLLDLSKIEAGKMDFNFELTGVNASIESVRNTLESWAKEQKVTLKQNLSENLPDVFIDTQRIEQIITNLISNAVKFSKENGEVEITTSEINSDEIRNSEFYKDEVLDLKERYVLISVKDNGIGIAKENWKKIFEQFEQIENSLSRKVGGSGLGIPIAKRLTDAHKGCLWLNSELNKGTVFNLALPVLTEEDIFWMSLELEIKKNAQEEINIALIGLCENIVEGKSFTNKILSEELIRKTKNFKEYTSEKDGKRYYYAYSVDVYSYVFDIDTGKIEAYIKTDKEKYKECNLKCSAMLIPREGTDINEIIMKIKTFKEV